jgi:hypothetical protein
MGTEKHPWYAAPSFISTLRKIKLIRMVYLVPIGGDIIEVPLPYKLIQTPPIDHSIRSSLLLKPLPPRQNTSQDGAMAAI